MSFLKVEQFAKPFADGWDQNRRRTVRWKGNGIAKS